MDGTIVCQEAFTKIHTLNYDFISYIFMEVHLVINKMVIHNFCLNK